MKDCALQAFRENPVEEFSGPTAPERYRTGEGSNLLARLAAMRDTSEQDNKLKGRLFTNNMLCDISLVL